MQRKKARMQSDKKSPNADALGLILSTKAEALGYELVTWLSNYLTTFLPL